MKKLTIALCAIAVASPALAHVTFKPGHVDKDVNFTGTFSTGHGCGETPTSELRITIPDGMSVVQTRNVGNWTASEQREGGRIVGLTYKTSRPIAKSEEIPVAFKAPNSGGTFYFPVTQICGRAKAEWTEIPAPGADGSKLKSPAPSVHVGPMTEGGHGEHVH